ADGFRAAAGRILDAITPLVDKRGSEGQVRRCHGDLHLNNIVLIEGRPTLFDALEFDEALATVDVLYDLGFLLMDLDAAGHRADANLLLAQYAWLDSTTDTLSGLAALPLFLALRAAVRAVVGLQRAAAAPPGSAPPAGPSPAAYMRRALEYLEPPPPRLVAIGGFSGTGKSTLGAALAPTFGAAPGALHLRSDLERKSLFGVGETDRLPPEAYTPEAGEAVYSRLLARAGTALKAGHSVVVDAVFADADQRTAVEDVARQSGARFEALWLTVTPDTAASRIRMRRGDASDATPEVAKAQMERGAGTVTWQHLATDAGADPTFQRAQALIPPDPSNGNGAPPPAGG
ncbi:MAG TPA: AAA family ATPase, partial [Hyphomicrobiaceae bacterium]|nr:AAA family ATPase [Hyphomicrobiaceae bacterium]